MGIVKEFPHVQMNGILKYFYDMNTKYNENIIKYTNTGYQSDYRPSNAFDFGTSNYWIGKNTLEDNFISFCFTIKLKAKLTGYELKTSAGDTRGKKWSFSGSNDNETWKDTLETEHSMTKNEIFYIDWAKKAYKCFKITCINNVVNSYHNFDIVQIELFGTLIRYGEPTCKGMCSKHSFSLSESLMIFFVSM